MNFLDGFLWNIRVGLKQLAIRLQFGNKRAACRALDYVCSDAGSFRCVEFFTSIESKGFQVRTDLHTFLPRTFSKNFRSFTRALEIWTRTVDSVEPST